MARVKTILFGPLPPPFGGVAIFMTAIGTRALRHGVSVLSYTGKPLDESQNEILFINHRRLGHLAALWRVGRRARVTDSTHFHIEYPNALLVPLWLLAKSILGFKWIKIVHDGSLPSRHKSFGRLAKWLFKVAIHNIDEFVVCSRALETWLRYDVGVAGKIAFVPPLLPLPPDEQGENLEEKAAESLGRFSRHNKRVCAVGIFIPSYGFHHVANAIEQLRHETREDIGLLIADGVFERDEDFRSEVLKGRDWIEVAENVPHSNLQQIYKQSNVFVRSFAHESYGLSRVEAIWCGVPVIATNVGETRGMLVYEYGDEATLIAHLKSVLSGEYVSDTKMWADEFQSEAQMNAESYLKIILGDKIA